MGSIKPVAIKPVDSSPRYFSNKAVVAAVVLTAVAIAALFILSSQFEFLPEKTALLSSVCLLGAEVLGVVIFVLYKRSQQAKEKQAGKAAAAAPAAGAAPVADQTALIAENSRLRQEVAAFKAQASASDDGLRAQNKAFRQILMDKKVVVPTVPNETPRDEYLRLTQLIQDLAISMRDQGRSALTRLATVRDALPGVAQDIRAIAATMGSSAVASPTASVRSMDSGLSSDASQQTVVMQQSSAPGTHPALSPVGKRRDPGAGVTAATRAALSKQPGLNPDKPVGVQTMNNWITGANSSGSSTPGTANATPAPTPVAAAAASALSGGGGGGSAGAADGAPSGVDHVGGDKDASTRIRAERNDE